MKITLQSYEITKAIKMYLKARGINWEDEYLEMSLSDHFKKMVNLYRYKQDQYWDDKKNKYITEAKYEIEGLYVKRKKKGQEKYQYVPLDKNCIEKDIHILEEGYAELEIYEEE